MLEGPGLHALVFILNGTNAGFTLNMQNALAKLKGAISDSVLSHVILVFTKVSGQFQCPVPGSEVIRMLALPSNHRAVSHYLNCSAFTQQPSNWTPEEIERIRMEWKECNRELEKIVFHITQMQRSVSGMQGDAMSRVPTAHPAPLRTNAPHKTPSEAAKEEAPITFAILEGISSNAAKWASKGSDDRDLPSLVEHFESTSALTILEMDLLRMYVLLLKPASHVPEPWIRLKHGNTFFFANKETREAAWDHPTQSDEPQIPVDVDMLTLTAVDCLQRSRDMIQNRSFDSVLCSDCLLNASLECYPHRNAWLFLCHVSLMFSKHGRTPKQAKQYLELYIKDIKEKKCRVDPLVLLAQARLERFKKNTQQSTALYALFRRRFPKLSSDFLWDDEMDRSGNWNAAPKLSICDPLLERWQRMKGKFGLSCNAMEDLLKNYDGQHHVKSKVLDIVQCFQTMKSHGDESQMELNAVFLGNPGTGDLFCQILCCKPPVMIEIPILIFCARQI